ncbi:hypothetical protein K3217_06285 [bacterium BD-1]|nr:hypothetical protein [Ottowia caeni]
MTSKPISLARAACIVLLGLSPVVAAQALPQLSTPANVEVAEGDVGTRPVVLNFVLDRVPVAEVSFDVGVDWDSWNAVQDADFVAFPARRVSIPAGQTQASVTLQVLGDTRAEGNQYFNVTTSGLVGASFASGSGGSMRVTILDDDVADVGDWRLEDDHVEVQTGFPYVSLDLDANDEVDRAWYDSYGVSFQLLEPPSAGRLDYSGSARVRFWLDPAMMGPYSFRYRLCLEDTCREAMATVNVLPFLPQSFYADGHSGYREVAGKGIEGRRLTTTPLAAPEWHEIPVGVDLSPEDAWDSERGAASRVFPVPARVPDGPQERLVLIEADNARGGRVFAGKDTDGNGRLSRDEDRCENIGAYCLLRLALDGQPGNWVLRVYNPFEFPLDALVEVHDVPVSDPAGTLTATGPGRETTWAFEDVHFGWNDPSMVAGERRVGFARLSSAQGRALVDVPVLVGRNMNFDAPPIPLVPGREQALRLGGGEPHPRIVVDVPAGAQSLRIDARSDAPDGTPFHLVRQAEAPDGTRTGIDAAPPIGQAVASGRAVAAGASLSVPAGVLAPGRWYVVPVNEGVGPVSLSFKATIGGQAPVVRPGSYFNASRPGSGLFLYPAGAQWTGLWYTYFEDGRPTWYYLQGAAPGDNGVRNSPVYRATWDGAERALTVVGEATLTPAGPDAFTLTYTIDGVAGSQPMRPLGRGCPRLEGTTLDASSTWFDPARVGTGYSVQLWETYEYHAAFLYDEQGVPMFLAAELDRFGGGEATLVLQRLQGACPTCSWAASSRSDVGTLVRRFDAGSLSAVEVDAVWQDGNPPYWRPPVSSWSSQDALQLLGGAGTTQGCQP